MRTSTKVAVSLFTLGTLAVSYKLGNPATTNGLTASGVTTTAPTTSNTVSLGGTPSALPTTSPTPSTAPKKSTKKKPPAKKKPTASGSGASTGTGSGTTGGTTTPPVTTGVAGTKTGSLFHENVWGGYVQVSVTKDASGTITAVNLVQANATGGRNSAFSILQQAAVQAQGSNFGNVSRATYTTQVFKQALDSALAKF